MAIDTPEKRRIDWLLKKAQDADLTAWENTFVEGLLVRWARSDEMKLSDRQMEILEGIADGV